MDSSFLDTDPQCGDACWSITTQEPDSARERILSAAAHLFCHRGFAATGVDSVIARAGTAKATLYKHFSSKDDLIGAVLDAEGEAWRSWFFGRLAEVEGPARTRILALFDVLAVWFADDSFYGCPFINAVAEFNSDNSEIRQAADKHKAHLITWLQANAMEMKARDPREVALHIAVLVDGAIVAAQHSRDPSFAQRARDMAVLYLDALQNG
jgi:AcrR family transcriptional regulator